MPAWYVTVTVTTDDQRPVVLRFSHSPVTIGSSPSCDVVLGDSHVSAHHAFVAVSKGQLIFHDLSTNGSFRDGARISEAGLGQAGMVAVPPYSLHFCLDIPEAGAGTLRRPGAGHPGDTPPPPPPPARDVITAAPVRRAPDSGARAGPRSSPVEGFGRNRRDIRADVGATERARPEPDCRLAVIEGPDGLAGRTISLSGTRPVVAGRSPDCDLVLDVTTVSRRHATFSRDPDGGWQVSDLESRNGVNLNGTPVRTARLAAGDRIALGNVVLRFSSGSLSKTSVLPAGAAVRRAREGGGADESAGDGSVAEVLHITEDRAGEDGRVTVLRLAGRVDGYSYSQLRDALSRAADARARLVAVDLAKCTYCDHTGMGVLLNAQTSLAGLGGGLRLFGASPRFRDALTLLHLDPLLKVSAGEEAAVEELLAGSGIGRRRTRPLGPA
jgi:anti-anti-sigma factor